MLLNSTTTDTPAQAIFIYKSFSIMIPICLLVLLEIFFMSLMFKISHTVDENVKLNTKHYILREHIDVKFKKYLSWFQIFFLNNLKSLDSSLYVQFFFKYPAICLMIVRQLSYFIILMCSE